MVCAIKNPAKTLGSHHRSPVKLINLAIKNKCKEISMIPKYKLHQVVGVKLSDTEEKADIIGIDIDDKIYYRISLWDENRPNFLNFWIPEKYITRLIQERDKGYENDAEIYAFEKEIYA
jgi:hypothetical protein